MSHRLKSLNQDIDEKIIVFKILVTLPEKYKYFVSAWESMPTPDKTLTNLTARLIVEESRSNVSPNLNELPLAFQANTNEKMCFICKRKGHTACFCRNKPKLMTNNSTFSQGSTNDKRCFKCNKIGHFASLCKFEIVQNKRLVAESCSICKKNNHSEADCYFNKNKNVKAKNASFLSVDYNEIVKTVCHKETFNEWVIDSGSSSHLSKTDGILTDSKKVSIEINVAKNSESMDACKIGTYEANECTLTNVLYVPDLSKNLLSVNAITNAGGEVKFFKNEVEVMKLGERILEGTKNENGLFTVKLTQHEREFSSLAIEQANQVTLWHRRLGHLGQSNLSKLTDLSDGMKLSRDGVKDFIQIVKFVFNLNK